MRKSGKLVEHISCPLPGCGSSDACAVYEQEDGTHDGFCYSCSKYVEDPYGTGHSGSLDQKSEFPSQDARDPYQDPRR